MEKLEFETFRALNTSYLVGQLKKENPSNVNFLEYRKYKVTIEEIEEPKEVLIERLNTLLDFSKGFTVRDRVRKEIDKLSK